VVGSLTGDFKATSSTQITQTYADLYILGQKMRADSKAVLEVTYLSPTVRICRSGRGEVYIFQKEREEVAL